MGDESLEKVGRDRNFEEGGAADSDAVITDVSENE